MNNSPNYSTGEEVHLGDKVLYMNRPAVVVFVIERDEFWADFVSQRDWYKTEFKNGIMLDTVAAGLVLKRNADEVQFVSRGDPPRENGTIRNQLFPEKNACGRTRAADGKEPGDFFRSDEIARGG